MALSFPQSTRALQNDRNRLSLVGIVVGLMLLLAWSAWFFGASITRYEDGRIVRTTRDDRLVAAFSPQAASDLRSGQTAFIRPEGAAAAEIPAIPAIVADINGTSAENQVDVVLYVQWDAVPPALWGQALTGSVSVAVEQQSPARVVARAAGQYVDLPAVSVSPRSP